MAIFRFGKKKGEEHEPESGADASTGGEKSPSGGEPRTGRPAPNPRKARRFFEYAATVADSQNYDYAIERYIHGLRYAPDSLPHHESLLEVALRRRVAGGKPAGFQERRKYGGGKTPFEKLLNSEFLWAKDPVNASLAVSVMEHAARSGLNEIAYWVGERTLEANRVSKRPSNSIYLRVRDLFAEVGAYERAIELSRFVLAEEPDNMQVRNELRRLESELARASGPGRSEPEEDPLEEDPWAGPDPIDEREVERLRADLEDNPEDPERLEELVQALLRTGRPEAAGEAIRLLHEAHERTGDYRWKVQAGDARMKQYNARLRRLRAQIEEAVDEALRRQLIEKRWALANEQVHFELDEYAERVKNDPADMTYRYHLGRRQFALGDYDAAIASFQEAQSDPKQRAWALRYLGEAFARKGWVDEAIDTFHRALDVHTQPRDRLALEIRYDLMKAMEEKARRERDLASAQEAAELAERVAKANRDYRDLRRRTESIMNLIEELSTASSA